MSGKKKGTHEKIDEQEWFKERDNYRKKHGIPAAKTHKFNQKKLDRLRRKNFKKSRQQGGKGNVYYSEETSDGYQGTIPTLKNQRNDGDWKHRGFRRVWKEQDKGGGDKLPEKKKKSVLGKIVGVFKKRTYVDHPVYGRLRY